METGAEPGMLSRDMFGRPVFDVLPGALPQPRRGLTADPCPKFVLEVPARPAGLGCDL